MKKPGLPEPELPFLAGAGAVFGPAPAPTPTVNILFLRDPKYDCVYDYGYDFGYDYDPRKNCKCHTESYS